jgi:hypothetical protein
MAANDSNNSRLKTITAVEEIFVDIRENKVEIVDPYKGKTICIDDYVMLYSSTGGFKPGNDIKFLGIHNTITKRTNENSSQDTRQSFWLKNSEILALLCAIVYCWREKTETLTEGNLPNPNDKFLPVDWLQSLQATAITIDPSNNWYGFVVDLFRLRNHLPKSLQTIVQNCKAEGFTLSLLAENGFAINASPNVFLQIGSDILKTESNDATGGSPINYYSLTLERTNLRQKYALRPSDLFNFFQGDYSIASLRPIAQQYQQVFSEAVINFTRLFELMKRLTLNQASYEALVLDLYDRNRNTSSVDLDDRLQNLIKRTVKDGKKGFRDKYDWATIISSVILIHAEDLQDRVANNARDITEFFSKKRVIQKMERIYKEIFNRKDPLLELSKYLDTQLVSWQNIKSFI